MPAQTVTKNLSLPPRLAETIADLRFKERIKFESGIYADLLKAGLRAKYGIDIDGTEPLAVKDIDPRDLR